MARKLDERLELTETDYARIGGLGGAIAEWADEALAAAAARMRASPGSDTLPVALRQLLLRLVRVGDHAGTPSTRDFAPRAQLHALTEPPAAAEAAIASLEEAGLVYTDEDQDTVALIHDALVAQWPALTDIVVKAAPVRRWKERHFAGIYEGSHGVRGRLRGSALEEAQAFVLTTPEAFSDGERRFVDEQRRDARREKRWRTARRIALPVALVVLAATAYFALRRSEAATRDAIQARANLVSAAWEYESTEPQLARVLRLEAYRQRPADEVGRTALARAVLIAPGQAAAGAGDHGVLPMPDLSQVIAKEDSGCGSVRSTANPRRAEIAYCGGKADATWAVSLGGRSVAKAWYEGPFVHLAVWQRDERQPSWSTRFRSSITPDPDSLLQLAVADDGTAAVLDASALRIYDGASQQAIPARTSLPATDGGEVKVTADGTTLLVSAPPPSADELSLDSEPAPIVALARRSGAFVETARWSLEGLGQIGLAGNAAFAMDMDDGLVRLDPATGNRVDVDMLPAALTDTLATLAVSPSGNLIALGGASSEVVELDLTTGGVRTLRVPASTLFTGLAVNDSGDLVIDEAEGDWSYHSRLRASAVASAVPIPKYDYIRPTTDGKRAAVVRVGDPRSQVTIVGLIDGVALEPLRIRDLDHLSWQPSGEKLLIARTDGEVNRVSSGGDEERLGRVPGEGPFAVEPAARIAVRAEGDRVRVHDLRKNETLHTIDLDAGEIKAFQFSENGRAVAAFGADRVAVIVEPGSADHRVVSGPRETPGEPGAERRQTKELGGRTELSSDGSVLASIRRNGRAVDVFRLASDVSRFPIESRTPILDIAVSHTRVAVLSEGGEVKVFNLERRRWLRLAPPEVAFEKDAPAGIRFARGGDQLLTLSGIALRGLTLKPSVWASNICAGAPHLPSALYEELATVGTQQTLCP